MPYLCCAQDHVAEQLMCSCHPFFQFPTTDKCRRTGRSTNRLENLQHIITRPELLHSEHQSEARSENKHFRPKCWIDRPRQASGKRYLHMPRLYGHSDLAMCQILTRLKHQAVPSYSRLR